MGQSSGQRQAFSRLLALVTAGGFWPRVAAVCLIVMGVFVGAIVVWHREGHKVVTQPDRQLTAECIHVTPQPEWISASDVKAEAIVQGGLGSLNLRQTDVTVRVAQAFTMHAWVARVKRCSKSFPGELKVDLIYRRPVAMVRVDGGWLPVDTQGVLLPPADFTQQQASRYPAIYAKGAARRGPVGTDWGDPRIHGGARLAELIGPHWKSLDLYAIVTDYAKRSHGSSGVTVELWTKNDTRVLWGSPPGQERIGEPPAETKLARLREFQATNGSLDQVGPERVIDLQRHDRLYVASEERK